MKKERISIFKKEKEERGMPDFVAQLVLQDTIKTIRGNKKHVRKELGNFLVLLKGEDGDDITQYVMQNYLGFGLGCPDKRILDRGEAINLTAEELKKALIEKFKKASTINKYSYID